jgi:endonuclease III-like uncharacterized protein
MFNEVFKSADEITGRALWLEVGRSMHSVVIKSVVINSSGFRPIPRTLTGVRAAMKDKMEEMISNEQNEAG